MTKDTKTTENTTDEATSESAESGETASEVFMRLIAGDPQFVAARPTGKAFVVSAAKPLRSEEQ